MFLRLQTVVSPTCCWMNPQLPYCVEPCPLTTATVTLEEAGKRSLSHSSSSRKKTVATVLILLQGLQQRSHTVSTVSCEGIDHEHPASCICVLAHRERGCVSDPTLCLACVEQLSDMWRTDLRIQAREGVACGRVRLVWSLAYESNKSNMWYE